MYTLVVIENLLWTCYLWYSCTFPENREKYVDIKYGWY